MRIFLRVLRLIDQSQHIPFVSLLPADGDKKRWSMVRSGFRLDIHGEDGAPFESIPPTDTFLVRSNMFENTQ